MTYAFKLDLGVQVHTATADQAQIFEDVKEVVHAALQGYNGTIFAYGQARCYRSVRDLSRIVPMASFLYKKICRV